MVLLGIVYWFLSPLPVLVKRENIASCHFHSADEFPAFGGTARVSAQECSGLVFTKETALLLRVFPPASAGCRVIRWRSPWCGIVPASYKSCGVLDDTAQAFLLQVQHLFTLVLCKWSKKMKYNTLVLLWWHQFLCKKNQTPVYLLCWKQNKL